MAIQGIRQTKNINQDRRVVDMSKEIALLKPENSPLTVILKRMGTEVANNPIFHWLEDGLQPRWTKFVGSNETEAGATITVKDGDGTLFNIGDIIKVPRTNEVMRVTGRTSDTLTVSRGYGVTEATPLQTDDDLLIIGNAIKEAGDVPEALSTVTTTVYNYTQIFKTSVKVSKTQEASQLYGGSDRDYQRSKKGIEHMEDLERAFIFGERAEHYGADEIVRTTGGVLSFLTTAPILDVSADGNLTQDDFDAFLEDVFTYGSNKKTLFASGRLLTRLNAWALDKLRVEIGEHTYGLATTRYESPHGILNIVKHPMFIGPYNGLGIILDMDKVKYRPLKGRDTKLETNIQPPGADYYVDQYLTEAGIMLKNPEAHAIIRGVQ